MKKYFLFFLFLLLPMSHAFEVPAAQQNVEMILIENTTGQYMFVILNNEDSAKTADITCSGDCGIINLGETSVQIPQHYYAFLPVSVSVPPGLNSYGIELMANGDILTTMTIKTTLAQSEIKELRILANTSDEIKRLETNIFEKLKSLENEFEITLNETKENMSASVLNKFYIIESGISNLTREQKSLATGAAISTTSKTAGIFVLGIIAGMIIIYVIFNKEKIKRRLFTLKKKYFSRGYEFKAKKFDQNYKQEK